MNYSAIDQYWTDKGYTEDYVRSQYNLAFIALFCNIFIGLGFYTATWWSRKKMSVAKLLGETPMNGWEKFCHEFKLGQTPAMNFVSSCLITNDRVFITLRVILAVWSLVLTIFTWGGNRSIFFGSYYPLATIITIYVSRNRTIIVEGFGSGMQFLNKLLHWLFSLQTPFRIFMAVTWWTKFFGHSRYRDMMKPNDIPRSVLFQAEFCPMLFLLTEMLWFDTPFDFQSCIHGPILVSASTFQVLANSFKAGGGTAEPQIMVHFKEAPAASIFPFWLVIYSGLFCGVPLAIFYKTKMWIFTKIPLIKERLQIRTQCIEIFKKRQILNKFLPKWKLEQRKSSARNSYERIGRQSQNRQTSIRKTQMGLS